MTISPRVRRRTFALLSSVLVCCFVFDTAFAAVARNRNGKPIRSTAAQARPKDGTPQISPQAAEQMRLLGERKEKQTPNQAKIQSRLLLARDRLFGQLDARLSSLRTSVATYKGERDRPLVDIGFDPSDYKAVLKALDQVRSVLPLTELPTGIRAAVAFDDLEEVAKIAQVRWIRVASQGSTAAAKPIPTRLAPGAATPGAATPAARAAAVRAALAPIAPVPAVRAQRNGAGFPRGNTVSEGDVAHRAAEARAAFGVNGTGVKIGVLSDGVDSLAALQASGDLPASVTVLTGQEGSGDEGSAMLEVVHDLAPGAQLYFATASSSEEQFAQNILDLRTAGCDVIVDDYLYADESPFRDGGNTPFTVVADAVQTVTAAGAIYFSAAGDDGNFDDATSGTWEGPFVPSTGADPVPLAGANLHTFGGATTTNTNLCTTDGTNTVLTWNDPIGTSNNDYDLYIMNNDLSMIMDASTDVQDGSGGDDFPVEIAGEIASGEQILVDRFAGTTAYLRVQVLRGQIEFNTAGATFGHSTVAAAFGVASVDVATASGGPFTGGAANPVETSSSDGPRRLYMQADGTAFPGSGFVDRQKPDLAAADDVSVSAPGYNPFLGTSASAAHAAAIAALVKSGVPAITPAQMRTALTTSALDIEAPGVDRDSGAGIVMAYGALLAAGASPNPAVTLQSATPFEVSGNGSGFFDPCELVGYTATLTNSGGGTATGISATLTSNTSGVTVVAGTSAYPDLAGGASASNASPLTVAIGPSVPCGITVSLTLTVTYSPSSGPVAFPLTFRVGRPGTPVTFSYIGPVVPIPDAGDLSGTNPGAPATATIPVTGVASTVWDVDFRFDGTSCSATLGSTTVGLDHSFVSDLHLTLTAPSTTAVLIANEPDGSGNNFCQTVLDDESSGPNINSVPSGSAPFTGSFLPSAPLSAFDGQTADGNWSLTAQDFFSSDTGNIRAFSIIITPATCDPVPLTITCPANVTTSATTGACSAVVTYTTPTTTNGCGTVSCLPASGSAFPVGTTTVTCTATDGSGRGTPTNTCTFTVTVNDTQAPTITCPANVSTTSNTSQGPTPGANVTYPAPTVADNCPGATPVCAPASGSFFPVGTTTVTCTATDASSNTASCSFTVTVGAGFTNCFVDDASGDVISINTNPSSPLYRMWQYRVAATGQIITGSAEMLSYFPNRSLIASDRDTATVRMDLTVNYSAKTATATVTTLGPGGHTYVLRDRNITNDPPCQ